MSIAKSLAPAFAALAAAIAFTSPAKAVVSTFTGGTSGTDALGDTWATGDNFAGFSSWAMPGVGIGAGIFNPNNVSNGNGTYATQLDVKFLGGVPLNPDGSVDFTQGFGVGFTEWLDPTNPYNQAGAWDTTYIGLNEVVFTAPDGVRLAAGGRYDLFVEFEYGQHIDPANFAFTATWSDGSAATPAPEPASLAMFGAGLAGFGVTRARKRRAASAK